ncbi:hypothetical protein O1611_g4084 [Lasiodiplodia mahajangana]|uniref:Uncharacterized protein n=1 Tax=Lasiodiplodia mahajangana TaxID=1108764 RepID=A0ACC2JPY7_9PEZI|nr:hypothetical protein O1611_g4084 [Lasiodiplodia mahajangana]
MAHPNSLPATALADITKYQIRDAASELCKSSGAFALRNQDRTVHDYENRGDSASRGISAAFEALGLHLNEQLYPELYQVMKKMRNFKP